MNSIQPFVYCGICCRNGESIEEPSPSENSPFWLTSCAHILCREHVGGSMLKSIDLERVKIICPNCKASDVSVVQINDKLPSDLKPYFKPFPSQLELLFALAQFQYCGLVELICAQRDTNTKLKDKVERQRKLLYAAKLEVSQVESLKTKLTNLERENELLKQSSGSLPRPRGRLSRTNNENDAFRRAYTIDLTHDEDSIRTTMTEVDNHETFIKKMQKSSLFKRIPSSHLNKTELSRRSMSTSSNGPDQFDNFMNLSKPVIMAESTNFMQDPITNRNSFTMSRRQSTLTPQSSEPIGIKLGTSSGNITKRPFRLRSATTQGVIQRLSSHLKVSGGIKEYKNVNDKINPKSPFFRRG